MTSLLKEPFYSSSRVFPTVKNDRVLKNSLLFPVSKAFLEEYPQYDDMIRGYDDAVSSFPRMLEFDKDSTYDKTLPLGDQFLHLVVRITNGRLVAPLEAEAYEIGGERNMSTPVIALMNQATYFVWFIGDIEYKFAFADTEEELSKASMQEAIIERGYKTGIPLMIGSKWCTLRQFDDVTLSRSGEDMKGYFGFFIIESNLRHIVPVLRKPINKTITLHNEHDNQLSRVEIQYSRNTEDYQNSYYVVASMMYPPKLKKKDNIIPIASNEFVISLQLSGHGMNIVGPKGDTHELFNVVAAKVLFGAFGCLTDEEMLNYVCPDRGEAGLVTMLRKSTLYGERLYKCYLNAKLDIVRTEQGFIKISESWTTNLARYVVGMNIFKPEYINEIRNKYPEESLFRIHISKLVQEILLDRFMPGVGYGEEERVRNASVCVALGQLLKRLYEVGVDARKEDSKQSLVNKRYFAGQSFAKQFKTFQNHRFLTEFGPAIQNALIGGMKRNNETLSEAIRKAGEAMGISQTNSMIKSFKEKSEDGKFQNKTIEAKSQVFLWNKMREVRKNPPSQKHGVKENWPNRRPDISEFAFICPTSSPDSSNVHKFKSLGVHTTVTTHTSTSDLVAFLKRQAEFKVTIPNNEISEYYNVLINGSVVGYVKQYQPHDALLKAILSARQRDVIPCKTTVSTDPLRGELSIWCDSGRIVVLHVNIANSFDITNSGGNVTVKAKNEFMKWLSDCNQKPGQLSVGIKNGFVEYLDAEMCALNVMLAPGIRFFYESPLKYTHICLNTTLDGIIPALNPTSSLNSGIKTGMATNHLKQAMGVPLSKHPMFTFQSVATDILVNAQEPLMQPAIYRYMGVDQVPIGENVTICFLQFKYNQDDAVIFNRESVERGLLMCDTYTTFQSGSLKNDEEFKVLDPSRMPKLGTSSCLPKTISSTFHTGEALIAKAKTVGTVGIADISEVNPMPDANESICPRPMRCVERVKAIDMNGFNKQIMTGQFRVMIPGDKVNMEQGQKNTAGAIFDPESLPYTASGKRADVYFNPGSIFKRKTYGASYVGMFMKLCALYGCFVENSSYGTCRTPEELVAVLEKAGLENRGFETMYDSETGQKIGTGIFFGVHYYERQHHLVESKINIRCKGQKDPTYLMPTHGKRVGGGLAVDGRLSLGAMNSAGSVYTVQDMHMKQCSEMEVGFCKRCGSTQCIKIARPRGDYVWKCNSCGKHPDIEPRMVSASFPLLNHIFNSLHIEMRYWDDDDEQSK